MTRLEPFTNLWPDFDPLALQGTVAADALRRAEDGAAGLAAEAARLRAALDAAVPAARHAAAQEEARRAAAEAQRLAGLMEGMVPREHLLACQSRADQASACSPRYHALFTSSRARSTPIRPRPARHRSPLRARHGRHQAGTCRENLSTSLVCPS